ncbi:cytochrome P450 [Streptomyces viridosporus]|uniref:cytochrome P450 n=1 Tax=Streptomyces viridosporus TaxID=67581 RepID=UPI0009BE7ADF|nr:cytochrome P450 [Streptomyces viridosporus]
MESPRSASLLSGERDRQEEARSLLLRVLDGSMRSDPYPVFDRIRESGPLWWDGSTVVFSSYRHCSAVLRAPEAVARGAGACPARQGGRPGALAVAVAGSPEHVRLRRLVARVLTPERMRALVPFVRDLVDDRLDGVAARGRLEAVTDLAYPLPAAVLCRLLDLPQEDASWLHQRALLLSPALDPHHLLTGAAPPGGEARRRAEEELAAYLGELVRSRGARSGDDPPSAPAGAEEPSSAAQLAAVYRALLVAGHETSVDLISGGVLALLRAPHVLKAVRRDPRYAGRVVEEVLRLDPPVQLLHRHAAAALDVCGTRVPAGTAMLLLLAAAHRDPQVRDSPGVFSPDGARTPHAAFGMGPHACPGEPVARLIAETVLVRFAQRVVGARFATGAPSYRPNVTLRGLRALWVDSDGFGDRGLPWPPA